jgi:hypothetical protein
MKAVRQVTLPFGKKRNRRLLGLATLSMNLLHAGSLSLTPGSVLLGQIGFPNGAVYEDTRTGTPIGDLTLPVLGDIPESLTVLNGDLFVGDGSGRVSQIDPITGNVGYSFNTPS